jgi:hypothetical protein
MVAVACGDDALPTDASVDTRAGDAPPPDATSEYVPDPPAAPALPALTPCPDGWAEIDVAGTPACEPWSRSDGPGCADGEVRFVGESCAPLGPACPADGVPTDLPAGPVLHVSAGSSGGDGSLATPYGTIAQAIAVASAGDVIAVHAGTYTEAVDLGGTDAQLVGACAAETIVDAPDGPLSSAAVLMTGDVSIARMTIRGGRPGLRVQSPGTAHASDVWVEASYIGVVVTSGGTLMADGLVVRDVVPGTGYGYGVFLNGASTLELRRGDLANLHGFGMALSEEGSSVLLEDVAVREVSVAPDGTLGTAIALQGEMSLTARRALVEGAVSAGILVQLDAEATVEGSLVRDIDVGDGETGFGLGGITRGSLDVNETRVEASSSAGFLGTGYQSSLTARDIVSHEIQAGGGTGGGGAGLFFDTGATADVERALVHRATGASIGFNGPDLDIVIRDASCIETLVDAVAEVTGAGLDLRAGARATFERVLVDGAIAAGVIVSGDGTFLDATDLLVEATSPIPDSDMLGRGASVQLGASVICRRCELRDSVEAGLLLHGGGSSQLFDLRVEDISASEANGAGMGVVSVLDAMGEIDGFVIQRNAVAGVQIATGGDLVIRNGVIAENPVGVNVQDATPNQDALSEGVIYRDNGRNLDSSGLPVPEATPF